MLFQRSTISGRLIAFSAVFVATAMVVASVVLWLIVAYVVREQIDQRLDTQIQALRGALSSEVGGLVKLSAQLNGPPFGRPGSGWYWQVSGENVHLTSRSLSGGTIEAPGHALEWRQLLGGLPRPGGVTEVRGQTLHTRMAEATVGNRVMVITATAPRSALINPAFQSLAWLLPVMAVLGASLIIGTTLQVRYGLRPLRQLRADIGSVVAGHLPTLPDPGARELQPVSIEINRLIEQNAQRLVDTRMHFANMAHGLKTPLASIMIALNDRNDPDGGIRQLVERIDRRIRHHLADGRRASSGNAVYSASRVKSRVEDLFLALGRIYSDKEISIHADIDPKLSVNCSAEDFDEIFGNLLDNAFKWASDDIQVFARVKGRITTISVQDDGPGMPETRIEEAFRPGLRLDQTVAGDGFGLSISKELIELHGGGIVVISMKPGLRVEVSLPVA